MVLWGVQWTPAERRIRRNNTRRGFQLMPDHILYDESAKRWVCPYCNRTDRMDDRFGIHLISHGEEMVNDD